MPNPAKLGIALFLVTTTLFGAFYVVFNNKKAQFYERDFSQNDDHLSKYVRRAGYDLESQYTFSSLSAGTAATVFANNENTLYTKTKADLTQISDQLAALQRQLQDSNPFRQLDIYTPPPLQSFNAFPGNVPLYKSAYLGLKHNPSYCDLVDTYNLYHPDNIFKNMNFVGDYSTNSLVKEHVFRKIGKDAMPEAHAAMKQLTKAHLDLSTATTAFFTKRVTFHNFYEIGKEFLCNSQIYNHIPGHGILTRKDLNVQMVNDYAKRYQNNQQCFNKKMFFPYAYRLNNYTECVEFFEELNSMEYAVRRQEEPVTFIIKKGYGAHRASGIYMFDDEKETEMRTLYANGQMCGEVKQPLLAQLYIANPLLLDKKNKFDFRMYMLIASVDPFIVYYHDGFLRVSLQPYDKNSSEKAVHFTNTHLSKELFKVARDEEEFQGMNETELRDYQMWTMEQLQGYLLQTGTINDPNWLDNYLRPKFKEAYLHTVRMSRSQYFKHPGVFEMFGLDFLLDEKLNLWFIECNASPQLVGTNDYKTEFLSRMLSDMFEIQFSLLRSRWTRIHKFMKTYHEMLSMNSGANLENLKAEFKTINTNYLEPEFKISENNSWHLIMDEGKQGKEAYMGHIRDECIDDA